jgi:ABC-type transporter Mla subunit MlaD
VKSCRIAIAVDPGERRELEAAAREAMLTVSAFVADQALVGARHGAPTTAGALREALQALNHATAQLRRAGVNFNQTVAALNSTGQAPGNLPQHARYTASVVRKVSDAADRVQQMLP